MMQLKILHLTDLHIKEGGKTHRDVWLKALNTIADVRPFDFVVISGDITNQASSGEFNEALRFIRQDVAPTLKHQDDLRRVIVVPGNHDIDWSPEVAKRIKRRGGSKGQPAAGETLSPGDYKDALASVRRHPERSEFRLHEDNDKIELMRIRSGRYADRFANFKSFVSSLHDGVDRPENSHYGFQTDDQHWSASVFDNEQVVFYGFNSCFRTDQYWRGACISLDSINKAIEHRRRLAGKYRAILVWHHGVSAPRGHPDFVSPHELVRLEALGASFALHGHIHESSYLHDLVRRRFPLFSVGSFGAEPAARSAQNEFAVISFDGVNLHREAFALGDVHPEWKRNAETFQLSEPRRSATLARKIPIATQHKRSAVIDDRGIARISVELDGLNDATTIPLAAPRSPTHQVRGRETAESESGVRFDVTQRSEPSGRHFEVELTNGQRPDGLRWEYEISNSFALTRRDLALMPRQVLYRQLPEGHDYFAHIVRFPTQELVLRVSLDTEPRESSMKDPRPWAFSSSSPVEGFGDWAYDATETAKMEVIGRNDTAVECRVRQPSVGVRYAVSYRLLVDGLGPKDDEPALCEKVLEACRKQYASLLPTRLSDTVAEAVASTNLYASCTGDLGEEFRFTVHLWDEQTKALLTAFGRFPPRIWGATFGYGEGIAGHCVRLRGPAMFFARPNGHRTSIIYRPNDVVGAEDYEQDWIVCVPILSGPEGAAVGALTFGSFGRRANELTPIEKKLRSFAEFADKQSEDPTIRDSLLEISHSVSSVLWEAIATDPELSDSTQDLARKCCAHWESTAAAMPATH